MRCFARHAAIPALLLLGACKPSDRGAAPAGDVSQSGAATGREQGGARMGAVPCPPEAMADAATGLVDLAEADPSLLLDIRYATSDNFMGRPLYAEARAFLVADAAAALLRAHRLAQADGYGITIFDAYRPLAVTRAMWAQTPRHLRNYVANPARGSKHNRGAAVDISLHRMADGTALPMPSAFDDFSIKAHRSYQGAPAAALANRARLESYMVSAGFRPMSNEWWHFDYIGWERYPVLDIDFAAIRRGTGCSAARRPG